MAVTILLMKDWIISQFRKWWWWRCFNQVVIVLSGEVSKPAKLVSISERFKWGELRKETTGFSPIPKGKMWWNIFCVDDFSPGSPMIATPQARVISTSGNGRHFTFSLFYKSLYCSQICCISGCGRVSKFQIKVDLTEHIWCRICSSCLHRRFHRRGVYRGPSIHL